MRIGRPRQTTERLAASALIALGTCLAVDAVAATCLDYSDWCHHAASISLTGTSLRRIAMDGDLVVLAKGSIGIQVLSVADPAHPVLLGALDTPGACSDVRLAGRYAYVSDGSFGLQVVDLDDPSAPAIVGNWNPGTVSAFDMEGARLAIMGTGGFTLLDLTDPVAPAVMGSCTTPTSGFDVALEGARAYLAGSDGLRIVDLANPAAPAVTGFIAASMSGDIVGVEAVGNVVHLVDNPANFEYGVWRIFDVTDPALPAILAEEGFYYALDLAIDGDMACVLDGGYGPYFFDISDPTEPVLAVNMSEMHPQRVVMSGGLCVLGGSGKFDVVTTPSLEPPPTIGVAGSGAWDVRVVGNHLFSVGDDGWHSWSLADPEAPALLATRAVDGVALDIAGSLSAVARGWTGLQLVDVSDPAAPILRGLVNTPGFAGDVVLYGNYAYVADGNSGLSVVNVATPSTPLLVTTIPTGFEALGVAQAGARLYVADVDAGLLIYDLADPSSPQLLGSRALSNARSVVVDESRAYVGGYDSITIVDVSNPLMPVTTGGWSAYGNEAGLLLDGDRLYQGGGRGLFYLFDVTDPAQPREVGRHFGTGWGAGIALYQSVLYVADPYSGIHLLARSCAATSGVPDMTPVPAGLAIRAAYPNPFRERIEFVVEGVVVNDGGLFASTSGEIRASILDVSGRLVRYLPAPADDGAPQRLDWDGRDEAGRSTPAGVYFLRVSDARSFRTTRFVRLR
jgi:hypothetical protein